MAVTMITMMATDTTMKEATVRSLVKIRTRAMEEELGMAISKVMALRQNSPPVIQVMGPPEGLEHRAVTRILGGRATNIPLSLLSFQASFRLMLKDTRKISIRLRETTKTGRRKRPRAIFRLQAQSLFSAPQSHQTFTRSKVYRLSLTSQFCQ
jgi:hypothetical protein